MDGKNKSMIIPKVENLFGWVVLDFIVRIEL